MTACYEDVFAWLCFLAVSVRFCYLFQKYWSPMCAGGPRLWAVGFWSDPSCRSIARGIVWVWTCTHSLYDSKSTHTLAVSYLHSSCNIAYYTFPAVLYFHTPCDIVLTPPAIYISWNIVLIHLLQYCTHTTCNIHLLKYHTYASPAMPLLYISCNILHMHTPPAVLYLFIIFISCNIVLS